MNPGLKGLDIRRVFDTLDYPIVIVANTFPSVNFPEIGYKLATHR